MDYFFILCLTLTIFSSGFCASIENKSEPVRKSRVSLGNFINCGLTREVSCFLDTADLMVEEKTREILAQADSEFIKTTGRANEENSPSQLSQTINKIISELTDIFKDGLFGLFKSAREGEEEDKIEESEEEKGDKKSRNTNVGEARKKKKKGKLIALIKLIIIGIVLKAKLTLLLKALSAALQIKFFLVALAGLILNAARFYLDLKKKHQPQKVIYYEHAQHQHHYEGDDDWGSSGPDGGYWGRSYDEEESSAHDLAYSKQKPYKKIENNKNSGLSWLG